MVIQRTQNSQNYLETEEQSTKAHTSKQETQDKATDGNISQCGRHKDRDQ